MFSMKTVYAIMKSCESGKSVVYELWEVRNEAEKRKADLVEGDKSRNFTFWVIPFEVYNLSTNIPN